MFTIGLDQYVRRRELPPILTDINEKILVELEDKEEEDTEEVLYWRKDYDLDTWVTDNIGKFDNCEELPMTKEHLQKLLGYLEEHNGKNNEDGNYVVDYTEKIDTLNDIIEYGDFEKFEYFYYAWW